MSGFTQRSPDRTIADPAPTCGRSLEPGPGGKIDGSARAPTSPTRFPSENPGPENLRRREISGPPVLRGEIETLVVRPAGWWGVGAETLDEWAARQW